MRQVTRLTLALCLAACSGVADDNAPEGLPELPGQGPEAPPEEPVEEPEPPEVVTECEPGDDNCFDCATVPEAPLSERIVEGARGYKGVAISAEGFIVGIDLSGSLWQSDYDGNGSLFVPGVGFGHQMTFLPNGDLAMVAGWSDSNLYPNSLFRVTPDGGSALIRADLYGYGVILGPDGMLYTGGDFGGFERVDPSTGASTPMETAPFPVNYDAGVQRRVLAFSPDHRKLYLGVTAKEEEGFIYKIDLDENLDPAGPPERFSKVPVGRGHHDGMAVDICGNLYVPEVFSTTLWKITPEGDVIEYYKWPKDTDATKMYAHGGIFGNGVGGWRQDALYSPLTYNDNLVSEIVIGVPSSSWQGKVANAPQ